MPRGSSPCWLAACALSFIVDHLAVARAWSQAMSGVGREVEVLVKVDVGFHRCGIDPHAAGAAAFVVEVARMKALKLRGLLSHAGQAYLATSDAELEAIGARRSVDAAHARRRGARAGRGDRRDQRRVDADRPLQPRAGRRHRAASRQLRVLRSHPGRPRRGDAGRLRADRDRDGRLEAGAGSHHPRLRQQNAVIRRRARRRIANRIRHRVHDSRRRRSPTPAC